MESATARANTQHQAWALTYSIPILLATGDEVGAANRLQLGQKVIEQSDVITPPVFRAMEAMLLADGPDAGVALDAAERASRDLSRTPPAFTSLAGYSALLDGLNVLRSQSLLVDEERRRRLIARKTLARLRRYALVFPFARPRLALYSGLEAGGRGDRKRATALLDRGLHEAETRGMLIDQAMLLVALVETDPAGANPERLARAYELCERLGMSQGLARIARLKAAA